MKKALIVGGSNGIGLSIACNMINKGYHVIIVDRVEPDKSFIKQDSYTFKYCNLLNFDIEFFEDLSVDKEIDFLMITAGFGRVSRFENLDLIEIKNQMTVNAVSIIEIIKIFYDRINSSNDFYTGVMVSICGRIVSPLFSTYSASKAALTKLIEALNIELEAANSINRILEISPGSLKGTKFNGGDNKIELLNEVTESIVSRIYNKETLYIPDYENTYKEVINRYVTNSHDFGLSSYNYKIQNNREDNKKRIVVGYLSGTFDLFHIGHLNLIRRAKQECDYLIVGVHPNASHKGKETFIPFEERKEIVRSCRFVDRVVDSVPEDSEAWELYHYDKLFVGSDYKGTERFNKYEEFFKDKNVKIVYFSYTQSTSSTQIRSLIIKETGNSNLERK